MFTFKDPIRARGRDLRGIINPSAHGRTAEEGTQLIEELWKRDLSVNASTHASEIGIGEMASLIGAGRFRVFDTLLGWASEYPLYRRNEKGEPNDEDCPLLASSALLAPVAPRMRVQDTDDDELDVGFRGRSEVTGY